MRTAGLLEGEPVMRMASRRRAPSRRTVVSVERLGLAKQPQIDVQVKKHRHGTTLAKKPPMIVW